MTKGKDSTLIIYADFIDEIPDIEAQLLNQTTDIYLKNGFGIFHILASSK